VRRRRQSRCVICETATRCRRCRICTEPVHAELGAVWPPRRATPSGSRLTRSGAVASRPRRGTPGGELGTQRGSRAPRLPQPAPSRCHWRTRPGPWPPRRTPSLAALSLAVPCSFSPWPPLLAGPSSSPRSRHLQTSPRTTNGATCSAFGPFSRAPVRWFYDRRRCTS